MKLQVIFESSDEGDGAVYIPGLPGCISEGDNKEQALANIHEVIELYLKSVLDDVCCTNQAETMELVV